MSGPALLCLACAQEINGSDEAFATNGPAYEALHELVELKRMKDAGTAPAEYERRKLIAWQTAFKVCAVIGEPKP